MTRVNLFVIPYPSLLSSRTLQELQVHGVLGKHKNILNLVAASEDCSAVYLMSELCNRGELCAYLAETEAISNKDIGNVFAQLMHGVAYCHSHGELW